MFWSDQKVLLRPNTATKRRDAVSDVLDVRDGVCVVVGGCDGGMLGGSWAVNMGALVGGFMGCRHGCSL